MDKIAIIIFLLIIILIYIYYRINNIFANRYDIVQITKNKYFTQLSYYDLKIRNSISRKEYIKKYINSFIDFSSSEKNKIKEIYNEIYLIHPIFRTLKIKFSKHNNPDIELNFPHTFDNIIILPQHYIDRNNLKHIIIHEYFHCWQRYNKYKCEILFDKLGFKRSQYYSEELLKKYNIYVNLASNPDIELNTDYFYNGKLLKFIYVVRNGFPGVCRDVEIDLLNKTIKDIDFKTNLSQQSQPNEIMAELLSRYFNKSNEYIRSDWLKSINEWIEIINNL